MSYGPPVPIPTPQKYNPKRDAESYTALLWSHINFMRQKLGFHHASHEPGGLDAIIMPLGGLADVSLGSAIADGAALVYDLAGTAWVAGTATTSGNIGQAFFEAVGTALTTGGVPGPTNLSGGAFTITQVLIAANGDCSGNAAGQSFSFGGAGGSNLSTGLTTNWGDGSNISASISAIGTATTYVTVDVFFTR